MPDEDGDRILLPNITTPNEVANSLRLLSFNIQAGSQTNTYGDYIARGWSQILPGGKRHTLKSLAEVLSPFDVVGLQEADPGSLRSGFTNQANFLAELAEFPFWSDQPNRRIAKIASSANAVLSRLQPTEVLDYALPGRMGGRGVLLCRYGEGDQAWHLAVTHLALGLPSRIAQLSFLSELLSDKRQLVLMGDFNCSFDAPEMMQLYRRTHLQPPPERIFTFPSWEPNRALDHILCAGFKINRYQAMPASGSDHLAIAADISLKPKT